ncbi:hypothetical protein U9M48_022481, partial [Paspalum notatum var. saurae]
QNNEYEEDIVQRAIERAPYKIVARDDDSPSIQVKAKDSSFKQVGLTEMASKVIGELKSKAEEQLGHTAHYAVMTIPQHFGLASWMEALRAGRTAGLDVVSTVSEPTAIAAAHGLHMKLREGGNALVLHVGGGTSDARVVTLMDGAPQVTGYWDDPFLGGDDFDQRIVDYFAKLIKDEARNGHKPGQGCSGEAENGALSSQEHVQVTIGSLADGVDFLEPLSRSKFEELNDDLFRKVVALVDRVLAEAELQRSKNKIDEIVLVGGSSMILKIQRLVKDYFGGREPNVSVKPDEAVALGAALHFHSSH